MRSFETYAWMRDLRIPIPLVGSREEPWQDDWLDTHTHTHTHTRCWAKTCMTITQSHSKSWILIRFKDYYSLSSPIILSYSELIFNTVLAIYWTQRFLSWQTFEKFPQRKLFFVVVWVGSLVPLWKLHKARKLQSEHLLHSFVERQWPHMYKQVNEVR